LAFRGEDVIFKHKKDKLNKVKVKIKVMKVTLLGMFNELNSFIPCMDHFNNAFNSGIDVTNNREFKGLVKDWIEGAYDEDPDVLLRELVSLLP